MNVRIVTLNSFPDGLAATSRIHCYAKALRDEGHTVEVTSPRNLEALPGARWLHASERDGLRLLLLDNRGSTENRWSRSFWTRLYPLLLVLHTVLTMHRADAFLVYFGSTTSRLLLMIVLRAAGKKVILELNEYPYAGDAMRLSRVPGVAKLLRTIVLRGILPLASGILVISAALEDVARAHAPRAKVLRVPILIEQSHPQPTPRVVAPEQPYLLHAGTLSENKDGIKTVLEAYVRACSILHARHGVRLRLYLTNNLTSSATWNDIQDLLKRNGLLDEVIVTGFLSESELQGRLSGALAHVVNKPTNLQNRHNFPTKLGAYLASGRPVILAAEGLEANRFLKDGENAFVTTPNDHEGIASAIVRCFEEPDVARAVGTRGVGTVVNEFTYARHAARISELVRAL